MPVVVSSAAAASAAAAAAAAAAANASLIAANNANRSSSTDYIVHTTNMPWIVDFAAQLAIGSVLVLVISIVLMAIAAGLNHLFPDKRDRYERLHYGSGVYHRQRKPYFLDVLEDWFMKLFFASLAFMAGAALLLIGSLCWHLLFG